jgi:Ni/Fe-hydrogenase subunit HybB-like protein
VNSANNIRVVVTKAVLFTILGMATAVAVARFAFGLGAATALTDTTPWGLWIGFDVLAGVALAAGGFVIAAAVHIFRLERYHALVRPAILTAFLGYVAVVVGLLMDLGRPWNIWRMIIHWQTDSPLFEVGWCVMLYSAVLALEFAPVVFEGLRMERPRRMLRRVTLVLVVAGIGLSTLHQSSLGTLFLLTKERMHPLWYTPILPFLFFLSAVGLGLLMVSTESLATSWLYRREQEWQLLRGLTRAAAVVLGLYLVVRLADLGFRGHLRYVVEGSWGSSLFLVEIFLSTVVPILLFTLPSTRTKPGALTAGAITGVCGFVLHRADVGGLAAVGITGDRYLPALTELIISLGVVSGLALIFLFLVERFPVWEKTPELPGHFTPPIQDPVTRTYFGGPWFGRTQLAAVGWIAGVVLGIVLLEATTVGRDLPEPRPVRAARAVEVASTDAEWSEWAALLVDGDRWGTFVVFPHGAHAKRLGGSDSCGKCHHRNLPLARATACVECHRDMYRITDTYSHERHVRALGGNRSCERCHTDDSRPKTREGSRPCDDCHAPEKALDTLVRSTKERSPGLAPGYRAAMHTLCVDCHRKHEETEGVEEPRLSRCANCHRGHSPAGEEIRVREGWSLTARLEVP